MPRDLDLRRLRASCLGVNPRKDHLRYVPHKGYQVQITVPPSLREQVAELAGKPKVVAQLTEYLSDKNLPAPTRNGEGKLVYPTCALRAAAPIDAKFTGWIEQARLGRSVQVFDLRAINSAIIGNYWHAGMQKRRMISLPIMTPGLVKLSDSIYVIDDESMPKAQPNAAEVVDSEAMLQVWYQPVVTKKRAKPTFKALKRKRSVIEQMFRFLELPPLREFLDPENGKPYRAYDLMKATPPDLQRFKESIPPKKQADILGHVTAIYRVAQREQKFTIESNPARNLYVPPKPSPEESWEPFEDVEANKIMAAALASDDPAIKWTQVLCALLGTITSEISRRTVADFKVDEHGNHYLDIPRGKSESRPRRLPLRWDILARIGFVRYLDSRRERGPLTPLFDRKSDNTADRNSAFLRPLVASTNKKMNGWRKRFINGLLNLKQNHPEIDCDEDRRRYLSGHAGKDVHAATYLRHPPNETKPILDLLSVPIPLEYRKMLIFQ